MAWMAIMLSPPGLFSMTTGLPQRACRRSWMRRAPMSAPAPGPNGRMNRTGPCGQACVCACACGAEEARIATSSMTGTQSLDIFEVLMAARGRDANGCTAAAQRSRPRLVEPGKTNRDAADRIDLERDRVFA